MPKQTKQEMIYALLALEQAYLFPSKQWLFKVLGIQMTPNVLHYLDVKDSNRNKRLFKIKTKEEKRNKQQVKFAKLAEWEAIAKKERSKRDGSYKPGQNMMHQQEAEVEEEEQGTTNKKPPVVKRSCKDVVCGACGINGHCTNRSKACLNYVGKKA